MSLLQRARGLATMSEDELRRYPAEAARDRDGTALWSPTEAHMTLPRLVGVSGQP